MKPLRVIGYWRNDQHPELPDPHDFVDEAWTDDSRGAVADYLRGGYSPWAAMGFSPCRICGRPNGSVEYTDGTYVWPEGLGHYVEDHAVRLPTEVEEYIVAQVNRYEDTELDHEWWVSATQTKQL